MVKEPFKSYLEQYYLYDLHWGRNLNHLISFTFHSTHCCWITHGRHSNSARFCCCQCVLEGVWDWLLMQGLNKVRLRLWMGETLNMKNHYDFVWRHQSMQYSVNIASLVSTSLLHYLATITQLWQNNVLLCDHCLLSKIHVFTGVFSY